MATLIRAYQSSHPPVVPKASNALKFGIFGAAKIAPNALITPALSHPDVIIYAVAARSLSKAQTFAKKHGIEKAYEGYQALIDDPEVDVIYNPLPNMLHYEWTMKALAAGKHVLNEKPAADTAAETREMFDLAEKKGLVLLEAYHYRFHPATHRAKEIIESKEIGAIKKVASKMLLTSGIIEAEDMRFDYELGGGALMDLGSYTVNSSFFFASAVAEKVINASHVVYDHPNPSKNREVGKQCDRASKATLALNNGATAEIQVDLRVPNTLGIIPTFPEMSIKVEGEIGTLEIFNFVLPTIYHSITVKIKGGATRTEKVYKGKDGKGEEWWYTYRYQLEAFVDKIRGREPAAWVSAEDSIKTMEWIEKVYEKGGLGARPRSTYVPS